MKNSRFFNLPHIMFGLRNFVGLNGKPATLKFHNEHLVGFHDSIGIVINTISANSFQG